MAINNADLQRLWDDAWDAAPEGENTFRPQLRLFESQVGALISQGSVQSVSKNSASQSYAGFSPGNLTQAEIARAWRQLINLFDRCKSDLAAAGSDTDDASIYAEGVSYLLDPPTECSTDFSEARCRA